MIRILAAVMTAVLLEAPQGGQIASPASEPEIVFYQDVAWSPDGAKIATSAMHIVAALWEKEGFGALQKSQFDIELYAVGGSSMARISEHPGNDMWPVWWPGGQCLLYAAERNGSSGLYFVKADGSDRQAPKGLPNHASQPSASPDGKKIAFMSRHGAESHIYVVENSATTPRKVSFAGPNNWNPVWSPDGTKILFFSDRQGKGQDQIFVVNADGSGETRLTNDGFNNVFPSWSPDGKKILFGSSRAGKGTAGIFVMDANGSNIHRLIQDMPAEFARWSPDGRRLAFISGDFPDTHIYVAGADGTAPTLLTR
jgi:Tol biopolymer transport system component